MLLKPDKKWNTTNMTIALHIAVSGVLHFANK